MEYIIYGAGGNGKKIFDILTFSGHEVSFFIDLYSKEASYKGTPIYRLDQVDATSQTVLVTLSCLSEQVKNSLIHLGFNNCLNLNEILRQFPAIFSHFYSPQRISVLQESERLYSQKLAWLDSILSDDNSKQCLAKIRKFRQSPSPHLYVGNDWQTQYFPNQLLTKRLLDDEIRFLDCGAYNGDTLSSLLKVANNINKVVDTVVCFEPEPENFGQLCAKVARLETVKNRIIAIPAAVWSHNTSLNFSSQTDQSTAVLQCDSDQTIALQAVSLDDVCFGLKPNFIKMDVEGAELAALHGAKNIIKTFQPNMAISVYHKPEHLWQIAELIDSYNENYRFYLHSHGDFCNEIVLYAVAS